MLIYSNAFPQKKQKTKSKYEIDFLNFSKPSIEFSYGYSGIKLNNSVPDISDAGMFDLKLGFTTEYNQKYGEDIINYANRFLFLGNASDKNLGKTQGIDKVNNTMWRFGFGNKEAYGLKFGSFAIIPYNSNSFAWSEFKYDKSSYYNDSDFVKLNDFNGTFRFGSTSEGGINFRLFKGFSLIPEYEISHIFPRHLFGKQLMSSIIEASGSVLLDEFIHAIMKSSPVAGTIVNFVLKNAYEYGFYQLRKDQMNWPFTSTAPLIYSTYKLGMNFVF